MLARVAPPNWEAARPPSAERGSRKSSLVPKTRKCSTPPEGGKKRWKLKDQKRKKGNCSHIVVAVVNRQEAFMSRHTLSSAAEKALINEWGDHVTDEAFQWFIVQDPGGIPSSSFGMKNRGVKMLPYHNLKMDTKGMLSRCIFRWW